MSFQFSLMFEGMCAFATEANHVDVYMSGGHGDHRSSLIIPADCLESSPTWKPSALGFIYDGGVPRQVAIWSLNGTTVTISSSNAAGVPAWSNKTNMIDLYTEHSGNATRRAKKDILAADSRLGLVTLVGKTSVISATTPTNNDDFDLSKNGTVYKPGKFTRLVEWKPAKDDVPTIVNERGNVIKLIDDQRPVWASISNVAIVSGKEGLTHFHHFYDGLNKLPAGDHRVEISQKFTNIFDCVPPVAWP
jgi:hypothetical protein